MTEVPGTGEDHGQPGRVGGCDDLFITQGTTRLDYRRYPCVDQGTDPIGEGKKRVGRRNSTPDIQPGFCRFADGEVGRIHAAPLPRADAHKIKATINTELEAV